MNIWLTYILYNYYERVKLYINYLFLKNIFCWTQGKVPRNAYGNVELFKESMLPAGTVYLKGTVYMYQGHSKQLDISQKIEMIQTICIFWTNSLIPSTVESSLFMEDKYSWILWMLRT